MKKIARSTYEHMLKVVDYVINKVNAEITKPAGVPDEELEGDNVEEEEKNEPVFKKRVAKPKHKRTSERKPEYEKDKELYAYIVNIYEYLTSAKGSTSTLAPTIKVTRVLQKYSTEMLGTDSMQKKRHNIDKLHVTEKAYLNILSHFINDNEVARIEERLTKPRIQINTRAKGIHDVIKTVTDRASAAIVNETLDTSTTYYDITLLLLDVSRGSSGRLINAELSKKILDNIIFNVENDYAHSKQNPQMGLIFDILRKGLLGVINEASEDESEDESEEVNEENLENDIDTLMTTPSPELPYTPTEAARKKKKKALPKPEQYTTPTIEVEAAPSEPAPAPAQLPQKPEPAPAPIGEGPIPQGEGPIPQDEVTAESTDAILQQEEQNQAEEQAQQQDEVQTAFNSVISNEPTASIQAKVIYYMSFINQINDALTKITDVINDPNVDLMSEILKRVFSIFIGDDNIIYQELLKGTPIFDNQDTIKYISNDSKFQGIRYTIGNLIANYDVAALNLNNKIRGTRKENLMVPTQTVPKYFRVIISNGKIVGLVSSKGTNKDNANEFFNEKTIQLEENKAIAALLNSGALTILTQTPQLDLTTGLPLTDELGNPIFTTTYSYRGITLSDTDIKRLIVNSLLRDFMKIMAPSIGPAKIARETTKQYYRQRFQRLYQNEDISSNLKRLPLDDMVRGKPTSGNDIINSLVRDYDVAEYMNRYRI